MTFHEIWSIVIPSVVGVVGVLSGIWIGQHLSDRKEERKENEVMEKMRYLLNADYTLINRMITNYEKSLKEWNDVIAKNDQIATLYVSDLNNMRDLIVAMGVKLGYFTYWDTITSSGNLMKLKPDELRIVNATHNSVSQIRNMQDESFRVFSNDVLTQIFQNTNMNQRISILRQKISLYITNSLEACRIIKEHMINVKQNISWVDLKTEPILAYKGVSNQSNKIKKEIFVREDGVTVYPSGMEVDRKGTILKMEKNNA
ncbi:hypothetical protein [Nitrosopumilus ureiphilus]|uniref:Uncharacterized protein n=1 Tax=Nitrosopumilus ureiphilus TaxID=1470067 RepID=A0A7D5R8A6_9ARCH|nr:hypothetical protein [Nitrosopumilus ureiphilus]QLH07419.1 hypothetical protein C5F50_10330 [Nitrosopumilus ureiphilus]